LRNFEFHESGLKRASYSRNIMTAQN